MIIVRYLALAALVVWLGSLSTLIAGDLIQRLDVLAYGCGGLIVVCLFVMKFVGPPPRAFLVRLAVVVAMLLVTAFAGLRPNGGRSGSRTLIGVDLLLGALLLTWYARE